MQFVCIFYLVVSTVTLQLLHERLDKIYGQFHEQ